MDRPLAKFKGPELKVFIKNIPFVKDLLLCRLGRYGGAGRIAKGLYFWYKIKPFLSITHVRDKASYPAKISKF